MDIHADQNLRLAQKMLEQQGEINMLRERLNETASELGWECLKRQEAEAERDDYWTQLGVVGDKAIAEHERAEKAETKNIHLRSQLEAESVVSSALADEVDVLKAELAEVHIKHQNEIASLQALADRFRRQDDERHASLLAELAELKDTISSGFTVDAEGER